MQHGILQTAAHWSRLALETGAAIWLGTMCLAILAWLGRLARRVQRGIAARRS